MRQRLIPHLLLVAASLSVLLWVFVLPPTCAYGVTPAILAGAQQPIFNDSAQTVTWDTPDACGNGVHPCNYLLWVNEPDVPMYVGSAQGGNSTTLTVPYPSDFCGTIQADVFFQSIRAGSTFLFNLNWDYAVTESNGVDRHTVSNCTAPTTTTTAPPTTTTTVPPTTTTQPPVTTTTVAQPKPPVGCVGTGCGHPQPPVNTTVPTTWVATPGQVKTIPTAALVGPQLPYTGAPVAALLAAGLVLLATAWILLRKRGTTR